MTEISVIIPVFKNNNYLAICLDSLKNQSLKNFEVIVVGDGVKPEIKHGENICVLQQKHQGPGAARNLGAGVSKGKILIFLDADMKFSTDFLQKLTDPIKENKAKGTFSVQEYVANWDNVWARCWNYQFGLFSSSRISSNFGKTSPVFRAIAKSEFEKVGGFDKTGYDDDWSLSRKLGYQAEKTTALYYHFNPDNLSAVFSQAKWRVKRRYRFGFLGKIINLLKYFLPVSMVNSLIKSLKYGLPEFFIFGLFFDFGSFVGLIEQMFFGENY